MIQDFFYCHHNFQYPRYIFIYIIPIYHIIFWSGGVSPAPSTLLLLWLVEQFFKVPMLAWKYSPFAQPTSWRGTPTLEAPVGPGLVCKLFWDKWLWPVFPNIETSRWWFQMGWNHQLDIIYNYKCVGTSCKRIFLKRQKKRIQLYRLSFASVVHWGRRAGIYLTSAGEEMLQKEQSLGDKRPANFFCRWTKACSNLFKQKHEAFIWWM